MSYTIKHGGKTITLPNFKGLPVGVIRKGRTLGQDEQMWFILETVLDEKQLAILDTMTLDEFGAAMNGWTQGAPLGESLKSSNS